MTDTTTMAPDAPSGSGARDAIVDAAEQVKAHIAAKREEKAERAEARGALKRRAVDRIGPDGSVDAPAYSDEQYEAAYADAQAVMDQQMQTTREHRGALRYLSAFMAITIAGLAGIYQLNGHFAPEYYKRYYAEKIADAFDNGANFGVFDLNIDIRNLRDAHIAKLDKKPDVVLLGASHWQEADVGLVTDRTMYNAHIHRDYYEDPLGMIEMLERHDRLPDTLILTIRDNQFTPIADRTDFLWLPGIPYYRAMAKQLNLKPHHPVETAPTNHWRDRLSVDMLHANVKRWLEAPVEPGPTHVSKSPTLDLLLPGGSIIWSDAHDAFFTQERARKEALDFAAFKRVNPPIIDPEGVQAIYTLLRYLHKKGVRVYLAHPPFNPIYWDAVQGSPYMEGLAKVKALVKGWADEFGWEMVGGFDPGPLGCRADQYIDAEHSNRDCLSAIFRDFMDKDRAYRGLPPLDHGKETPPLKRAPAFEGAALVRAPADAKPVMNVVKATVSDRAPAQAVATSTDGDWRTESAPRVVTIQLRATFD